jgi:hypothetical protein
MGYVKTQADAALKAGNYKDAYTKCVTLLQQPQAPLPTRRPHGSCGKKSKKKTNLTDLCSRVCAQVL